MSQLELYKIPENFFLLEQDEISHRMTLLKEWECLEGKFLRKKYHFNSYREAKAFVDLVADFAEKVNHHPNLLFGYKFVEVTIWTHNVGGLSEADFMYTKDVDKLYCNTSLV